MEENTYRECSFEELERIDNEKNNLNYIARIKNILKSKIKDKDKLATNIYYNVISGCDYGCNIMELFTEENITLTEK